MHVQCIHVNSCMDLSTNVNKQTLVLYTVCCLVFMIVLLALPAAMITIGELVDKDIVQVN